LSLALSGADCPGQAENAPAQAGQDLKSVTCPATGVTLVWAVDRDDLIGMLKAPGAGWVAVGFCSDRTASAGKLVIGSVVNGRPVVRLKSLTGVVLNPDGQLLEAHATREGEATVIIFRARLNDLGLVGKVGKPVPIILARSAAQDGITQYKCATVGAKIITL
jgi:hypothetical protein